jgi:hypothetical protein
VVGVTGLGKWPIGRGLLVAAVGVVSIAAATASRYRAVSVDSAGRLHIVLDSGGEVLPPKAKGQVSFGNPAISPDERTVGWLVLYAMPAPPGAQDRQSDPIAGALVLYRSGRVIQRFRTEQTFWDWQFQDAGRRVAYCTGPTHGGAAECVLREVESGRIVAAWLVKGNGEPPAWARTLRW